MDPDQTGGKKVHDILHFPDSANECCHTDELTHNLPIYFCPENVCNICCIYSNFYTGLDKQKMSA